MKLSNTTVKILSNFAAINPGMIFNPGNIQYTISPLNTIVCKATLAEDFPQTFAIYDLEMMLKLYKTIDDAELEFGEDHLLIKNDREQIKFYYADSSVVVSPKKFPYNHDDVVLSFPVDNDIIQKIKSLANSATFFKHLKIHTKGTDICLALTNKESRERAINQYMINVGQLDETFETDLEFYIQMDSLKVLDGDCEFVISNLDRPNADPVRILRIDNNTFNVQYWSALDS